MLTFLRVRIFPVVVFCLVAWGLNALAQAPVNRVVRPIDAEQLVTLTGNVHPLARGGFDLGVVEDDLVLERMLLELEPSPAQQAELDALVEAQHDPTSPIYQQWLTPAEYGARFGASAADVARITGWLQAHGFKVDEVAASNRLIQFSGTAAQVAETFHTAIHRYNADGAAHIANEQDPQIPAVFAGVVGGVVSLHDFRRTPQIRAVRQLGARPEYTSGAAHYLFPADWATIYDLNPLYAEGTKGTGTSIAIVGRSNINASDLAEFRTASGMPANAPAVILVSTNPGLVSGDQIESTLDVEWSGAIAPAAGVKFVVGASTATTDGIDLSAQYIVNHATAPVVSTSYGSCEQEMGAAELAFYNGLWQQAASEGISAFVSSGDSGAAGCNAGSTSKGTIAAVNGLCSSSYSTCVGGTEFNEGSNTAKYWAAANAANYESALSYIPEKVWNESSLDAGSGLWASGGGESVIYPAPSWQKGLSAANGMRAVPDVAMTAAGHDGYMIVEDGSYWVVSGTSAASPSFAGVMALLVQSQGGKGQGNANPGLYAMLNAAKNPFHPTPSGNNTVPGVTGFNATGGEYNLATGLGSVDGAVLISSWGAGTAPPSASINFALTESAASGTVLAGKSATFTIAVTESGTGKNAVALTAKTPAGMTATISPASITPGTTATVTLAVASTAAAGAQSVTITGSDSSGSQTLTYALTVTAPPTLILAAASTSVPLTQGATATVNLTAATGGSFGGNITWSVSGLPSGVTAGWSANPMTPSASPSSNVEKLTLAAAFTAKVGSATITVTASGDGLTATQQITVQITQAPGLQLALSASTVSITHTSAASIAVTIMELGGLSVPITVSLSGLPAGVTPSLGKVTAGAPGSESATLTLSGSSAAKAGTSTVTVAVTGSSNGTTYTTAQALTLQLK